MKLVLTQYGTTVTVETPVEDLTAAQVTEVLVRPAMRALGWHEDSLRKVFGDVDHDAISAHEKEVDRV